jgi:ribosomal protein S24E
MKIVRDFTNSLLKRKELEIRFNEKSNPGFEKVKSEIVKEFKASEDLVLVKSVKNNFGDNSFLIDVFIYESAEGRDAIESKKKEKKKKGGASG